MIFQHHRFQVWNASQHPYKHSASDFSYSNPALGEDATTITSALDWLFKVVYPQPQDPVATPAALPLVGNTINDYRVVTDDGDGKAAAYRWEQREGDASPSWYKIYDMDWGVDSVLSGFFRATQDHYVVKRGTDDIDSTGAFVAGTFAGQRVYGGASANTNLTLSANAGDGTGAQTGFVQFTDQVRPTADGSIDLGTSSNRFRTGYLSSTLFVGNLAGTFIQLDNNELTASGAFTLTAGAALALAGTTVGVAGDTTVTGTLTSTGTLTGGGIVSTGGSLTSTTGTLGLGTDNITTTTGYYQSGTMRLTTTGITATGANQSVVLTPTGTGVVSTGGSLSVTGTVTAGALTVDQTTLDANTFTTTAANDLTFTPGGVIVFTKALTSVGITATGTVGVTGQLNADNLRLDGNVISATNAGGDITLTPNGAGNTIQGANHFVPNANNAQDLGTSALAWRRLYFDTALSNGTVEISAGTLLSLRDILVSVDDGDVLRYNAGALAWEPVSLSGAVDHGGLTGLGDDDHTQYALLAGRSGGQTLNGSTLTGEDLTLRANSAATNGTVFVTGADFSPTTDNVTALGDTANRFTTLYMSGELHGARLENFTTAGRPAASAGTPGRVIWDTDLKDILIDIGGSWQQRSVDKYYNEDTTGWNGSATSVSYTMPSDISDARKMVWQLKDNSNNFKVILADITHTGATNVTVTVDIPLAAGTYTLIGVG